MLSILTFVIFIGSPSPQNIHSIDIYTDVVEVDSTDAVDEITEKIFDEHPELRVYFASFYKPKSKASLNESIVRQALQDKTLDEYADELIPDDMIHEVFGVAADESLPRWSLIVCLERPTLPWAVVPASTQVDANDIVGQLEQDFKKYVKAVSLGKKTPSSAARSINYNENQASSTTLLDGRFNKSGNATTALPIELYHPAFAHFLSNAQDPNLQVPDDVLRDTARLIRQLSAIRTRNSSHHKKCRQTLADIIGSGLIELVTRVDDVDSSTCFTSHPTPMNVSAAPGIFEITSELGNGGYDPSVKVSFSYAKFYCQENLRQVRDISCCPSFLIGLAGPWIGIFGAVITSRTIVQRLSGFEWFGASRTLDMKQVMSLGRLLYALRLGIAELKEYYSNLTAPGHIAPRFCPYITSIVDSTGQTINFSYVKPLKPHPTCATFQVKLLDGDNAGKLAVVKFVEAYCVAAHIWLADKGFAPRLLHDGTSGPRYGDLGLIVMDFVEGMTLHDVYGEYPISDSVRKAIRKALDEFAKGGFIFGDLRTPNIMLAQYAGGPIEKRLRFIEFDRACREGDGVRYPFHLSHAIQESAGASDREPIKRKHQELMFKKLK